MLARILPAALVVAALLAGCAAQEKPMDCPKIDDPGTAHGLQLGLITPTGWNMTGKTDVLYVWVHNTNSSQQSYAWKVTGPGGAALPEGLTVCFASPAGLVKPNGTKTPSGGRVTYPDWQATLATATVIALPTGDYPLELHAGDATLAFTAHVAAGNPVSKSGDSVTVQYDGKFQDTGARFDQGSFSTQLGSGQTVPGFDNGLMGLRLNEKAHLVIPAAFAYGYDNGGNYAKFNGKTLLFDVTITKNG